MSIHLHRDLENLQKIVLRMASAVEENVERAVQSLLDHNVSLAAELKESDRSIDMQENKIEEECLKILALHQPVAIDLRRVAAILKINTDLERMADLAVNISERAAALSSGPEIEVPRVFRQMTDMTNMMVRDSIDAFVHMNDQEAKRVCRLDDEVDSYNRQIIDKVIETIKQSPESVESAIHLFSASRHLERIADHATNIAEDVVYMVEGRIIRHHPEEYSADAGTDEF